jgi:superfamily I DNA/RNA helicase/Zn-dependent peptidase ImmA (M78 family)
MDAFGAVRLKAKQVRAHLLGKYNCGESADQVLAAAMQEEGLKVLRVPKEYPLLGGGMGALQRHGSRIFISLALDPDAQRFVQAHEFGHWVTESPADPVLVSQVVDATVPEQATPLGAARVEGYSAQELRERYANVFAREFLLPTTLARQLFVNERRSASDIAKALKLSVSLVTQQLQYALLVPEPPPAQAENPLPDLDDSQRLAAEHEGSPALIGAGPGTGKTRTLIGRIEHLLANDVDPRSILALTFSNKAAREIKERIARTVPAANELWAGTFHAFGLELLRKHATLAGLREPVRLVDSADALERLESLLPQLDLSYYLRLNDPLELMQDVLGAISCAKDELCSPNHYAELAENMRQAAGEDGVQLEAAAKAAEVARVYARYEQLLREQGAVDFGDLIWGAIRLLENNPDVLAMLRAQYPHVLVDEYQDVNRASSRLLKLIADDGKNLWVVGDVRQAIYRFRGASPGNMRLFTRDFPGATVRELKFNYRSGQRIVDTFTTFARSLNDPIWKAAPHLHAVQGEGHRPKLLIAPTLDAEVAAIAQAIEAHRAQGIPYRNQAVVVRTHTHAERVALRLQALGVPSMYLGDIFERDEVRSLLAVASFVAEPSRGALLRLALTQSYRLALPEVRGFLDLARAAELTPLEALSNDEVMAGCSAPARAALERLRDDLAGQPFNSTVSYTLNHVLFERRSLIDEILAMKGALGDQRRLAIFQLLQFAAEHFDARGGNPKKNLLRWIRRLEQFGEEKALRELPAAAASIEAVRLMTVHASKGLEFPVVYLPYLAATHFPQPNRYKPCPPPVGMLRAEDVDDQFEEESLFYVGLSRARDHLVLSRSEMLGSRNIKASSFLDAVEGVIEKQPVPALNRALVDDELPLLPELKLAPDVHDAKDLDQYERCPRKYAYARSLGLRAGGDDEGYVRFHRAVSTVLGWVISERAQRAVPLDEYWPRLEAVWEEHDLAKHAFASVYKDFAVRMLTVAEAHLRAPGVTAQDIELPVGGIKVKVHLDHAEPTNGGLVRRYKTGRRPKEVKFELHDALRLMAGRELYGPKARLQLHFLSSENSAEIEATGRQMDNKVTKVRQIAADIAAGKFPIADKTEQCPSCPFFFLCPAIPEAV